MKLWEALKIHEETGRGIRPKIMKDYSFAGPERFVLNECLNDEWEVDSAKVVVTRESLFRAMQNAGGTKEKCPHENKSWLETVYKELNL